MERRSVSRSTAVLLARGSSRVAWAAHRRWLRSHLRSRHGCVRRPRCPAPKCYGARVRLDIVAARARCTSWSGGFGCPSPRACRSSRPQQAASLRRLPSPHRGLDHTRWRLAFRPAVLRRPAVLKFRALRSRLELAPLTLDSDPGGHRTPAPSEILFVDPNSPAQFGPVLTKLAGREDVRCVFVTKAAQGDRDGPGHGLAAQ